MIEAKKETLGQNITTAEEQTEDYAAAKLKCVQSDGTPLPFNARGGLAKLYQLFGDNMDALIAELNQELTA